MAKIPVDILFIALNEIQFDARLFNLINNFLRFDKTLAALTLDRSSFNKNNLIHYKIQIDEKKRTFYKALEFYKKASKFIKKFEPRVIICSDVYSLPLGFKFKQRYNAKLIYDSREIYSSLASLKKHPLKQYILSSLEKRYIRYVDKIIVTGELDKEFLSTKFPKKQITIIHNYPRKISNPKSIDFKHSLGIETNTILAIYQGVLLEGRGIELSLRSLLHDSKLHLVIAGGGPLENRFKSLAKEIGVENRTHFLGNIPYSELLNYTMACNVGLCLIEPISFSYELALPNKFFEYIQARIPVVATRLVAIEKVFGQYKVGELVPPDIEPKELARVIRMVAENTHRYKENLNKASEFFVWENQEPTISELLQ